MWFEWRLHLTTHVRRLVYLRKRRNRTSFKKLPFSGKASPTTDRRIPLLRKGAKRESVHARALEMLFERRLHLLIHVRRLVYLRKRRKRTSFL